LGKGYCLNYDAGVYRRHAGGIYSNAGITKQAINYYNIYNELYFYNQDDDIIKFKVMSIKIYKYLLNNQYSIALVKDIISTIKMAFHYGGLKTSAVILVKMIMCLFKVNLFTIG
jgi:hypothetical protein